MAKFHQIWSHCLLFVKSNEQKIADTKCRERGTGDAMVASDTGDCGFESNRSIKHFFNILSQVGLNKKRGTINLKSVNLEVHGYNLTLKSSPNFVPNVAQE